MVGGWIAVALRDTLPRVRFILIDVLIAIALAGCSTSGPVHCDCPAGPVAGLVLRVDRPVTRVALSGGACSGGHFRCAPAAFDDAIHGDCTEVQVAPHAAGTCHVELSAGSRTIVVERTMIDEHVEGCCGYDGIVEASHDGEIDLVTADAGVDASTDAGDDGT